MILTFHRSVVGILTTETHEVEPWNLDITHTPGAGFYTYSPDRLTLKPDGIEGKEYAQRPTQ